MSIYDVFKWVQKTVIFITMACVHKIYFVDINEYNTSMVIYVHINKFSDRSMEVKLHFFEKYDRPTDRRTKQSTNQPTKHPTKKQTGMMIHRQVALPAMIQLSEKQQKINIKWRKKINERSGNQTINQPTKHPIKKQTGMMIYRQVTLPAMIQLSEKQQKINIKWR